MPFTIVLMPTALEQLNDLAANNNAKWRKVVKTLGLMETNLKHPGLQTHEYSAMKGENGEKIFEAYVENNTPGAYRVFWHYAPNFSINVVAILPHP